MANTKATSQIPSRAINSGGGGGVCMMSNTWRDEQHPSFINFISTFLTANAFRLNFVPIAPDFIFNCGGSSVAFIFVTSLDPTCISQIFGRVQKLKLQFANLYVVITLPTKEKNDLFVRSYFKKQTVQAVNVFQRVVTSIPGIDNHDANALNQAIGSIEAISKASKEQILENTDLSADKAEVVSRFFRDPKFYLSPKIN
ncbi:hypothetical protein GBA52_026311 [Prunus armeniaca]|nr:hypothetical protein GBA52_026311 [Prunus armeniaca]